MKVKLNDIVVFIICIGLFCCTDTTKTTAKNPTNDALNNSIEKDSQLIVEMMSIHLQAIYLGQLAQTKAMAEDIKKLSKVTIDTHTNSLNKLKTFASKKIISIPTSLSNDAQEAYNKLTTKSENNFDKAYSEMTVDNYKDAIKQFESTCETSTDIEIKEWAKHMLPELRTQLDQAMTCAEKYK